jgi:hypothetical protein
MTVIEACGGVNVKFWKTHTSHKNCLSRLNLTEDERASIAGTYRHKRNIKRNLNM